MNCYYVVVRDKSSWALCWWNEPRDRWRTAIRQMAANGPWTKKCCIKKKKKSKQYNIIDWDCVYTAHVSREYIRFYEKILSRTIRVYRLHFSKWNKKKEKNKQFHTVYKIFTGNNKKTQIFRRSLEKKNTNTCFELISRVLIAICIKCNIFYIFAPKWTIRLGRWLKSNNKSHRL